MSAQLVVGKVNRRAALLDAWRSWDARPYSIAQSQRFELQCRLYANHVGMTATELRTALMAARRDGLDYAAALASIEGPL